MAMVRNLSSDASENADLLSEPRTARRTRVLSGRLVDVVLGQTDLSGFSRIKVSTILLNVSMQVGNVHKRVSGRLRGVSIDSEDIHNFVTRPWNLSPAAQPENNDSPGVRKEPRRSSEYLHN
jgi:hypothetical protein